MQLGRVKAWHIGIGLPILTAVLLWSYLRVEPADNSRTTSAVRFQQLLYERPVGKTNPQPRVQDIRITPPVEGLYTVRFVALEPNFETNEWEKKQWSFTGKSPAYGSKLNMLQWLEQLQKGNPQIKFTYEWWREERVVWRYWAAFAALCFVGGVAIPGMLWAAKGGLKDLNKDAKKQHEASEAIPSGPVVTQAQRDQLDEMLDRLEGTASQGLGARVAGGADGAPATEADIKKLESKPLEVAAVAPTESEDPKDYKGEFYPVARPGGPGAKKEDGTH